MRNRVDCGFSSGLTRMCLHDLHRLDRFVRSSTGSGRRSSTNRASGDWNARCSMEARPSHPQSGEDMRSMSVSSASGEGILRPSPAVRASRMTGGLVLGFLLAPP